MTGSAVGRCAKKKASKAFRKLPKVSATSGTGEKEETVNRRNGTLIGNQGMAGDGRSVPASLRVGTLRPLLPTTSPCADSRGTNDSIVKEHRQ